MAHAAIVHLLLELLAGQAGADLLLERQPADARVLDAFDLDRLDALADAGQHDRQRVHDEAGIHAGPEHGHLRLLRHRVHRARVAHVALRGIGQLLGRRDDRHPELQDRLDLGEHALHRRAGAQHDDVRLRRLDRLPGIVRNLDLERPADGRRPRRDRARLGRVDVDGADDLESLAGGDLPHDAGANGPEAEMHDPDRALLCCHS